MANFLREGMKKDFQRILNTDRCARSVYIYYHKKLGNNRYDTVTGNYTEDSTYYKLKAYLTKFEPKEATAQDTLIELGKIVIYVAINDFGVYTTPEVGLHIEPSINDFFVYNGDVYELNQWERTAYETEYRLHARRTNRGESFIHGSSG